MAHFEPRDEDVDMLLMLVEAAIPRQEAISRLKGNNNNVEQALNEFFDNKDTGTNKYRWDEGQFNSDRDGGSDNHGISFDIHAPDDPGPFGGRFDGAPSRPPSRTSNNKSPLSKVIDLTAEHALADPRSSMKHGYNEDPELAQALAASRADLGMPPQESGITGTDEVHFGPANRNQYEQGQWDMVPMSRTSAQEILLDPDPVDRKREPGTPAFLKPSVQDTRLNAVITIYHEIPLTRNLFLNTTDTLANYGHDAEWWSGKAIQLPAVVMEGSPPAYDEVDRELQRLMAFLDNTERSYGSVEPLANFREVKQALRNEPDIPAAVFRAWKRIFEDQQPGMIRQIFSTGVAQEDSEDEPKNFAMLELELPSKDSCQETLYDICDEVLWPSLGPLELSRCPYLSRIAEVISFKVEGGGNDRKNVVIPAVWYPDRYLKAGRQAALDMRLQKRDVELQLQQIRNLEDTLTHFHLRSGKIVSVQDLFKASLKHDEAEIAEHEQIIDVDVDMMASQRQSNVAARLSQELQKVVASIDKKLQVLEVEKERARKELRKLSKLYTEPSSENPALHKYTLRGVSTTKSTMFICRQAEVELIDLDTDDDDSKSVRDQWWRIHYAPMGSNPVTVEKTTEAKVLAAAMESKNAILVYASEKAMSHGTQALPKPLETFVRFDNKTFNSEFHEPEESEIMNGNGQSPISTDGTLPVGLSSPGKRKFDESSLVNQDSNPYAPTNIAARELRNSGSDDVVGIAGSRQSVHQADEPGSKSPDGHDVIMGVEPPTLETPPQTQEMQERGGMSMLSRGSMSQTSTLDSMDLDQIMEDDSVAGESAAVKRVGFA